MMPNVKAAGSIYSNVLGLMAWLLHRKPRKWLLLYKV
jgi:hypothetical protein